MKHFAPEQLAAFVREILPGTQHGEIRQHLPSCSSCTQLVEFYRHIIATASREPLYAPPDGVVRTVKAYFATQRPVMGRSKVGFELLFDSLARPATAGARSSVVSARQLLYRVGTVYVDMEVDRETASGRASLVGQMLDSSRPDLPMSGVPVVLLNRGRRVARTSSNNNGEFQLDFAMATDLKLSVAVDRRKPVYLPITSPQLGTSKSAVSSTKKRKARSRAH
jgi:hypothetical protein